MIIQTKLLMTLYVKAPHAHTHYQRIRGYTYARSTSHEPPPPPPSREKDISHISSIGYHWQIQKSTPPFPALLEKSSRNCDPKYPPPPSRENGNKHAAPFWYAFEWGGGGGWRFPSILCMIYLSRFSLLWYSKWYQDHLIWFGSIDSTTIFLKHSHLRFFFLNLRELFTTGIAVHKFFLCFVRMDEWAPGQQCMEVRKAKIPDWNVTKMKGNWQWRCFQKLP